MVEEDIPQPAACKPIIKDLPSPTHRKQEPLGIMVLEIVYDVVAHARKIQSDLSHIRHVANLSLLIPGSGNVYRVVGRIC